MYKNIIKKIIAVTVGIVFPIVVFVIKPTA